MNIEIEFLANQRRQLARSDRLARRDLLLDKPPYLALEFVRTAWPALFRDQPGDPRRMGPLGRLLAGRPWPPHLVPRSGIQFGWSERAGRPDLGPERG